MSEDMLVHYLRQRSATSLSTDELVALSFAYRPIWAVPRAGWVALRSGKSCGGDLNQRREKGTPGSDQLFCSVNERFHEMEQFLERQGSKMGLWQFECMCIWKGKKRVKS